LSLFTVVSACHRSLVCCDASALPRGSGPLHSPPRPPRRRLEAGPRVDPTGRSGWDATVSGVESPWRIVKQSTTDRIEDRRPLPGRQHRRRRSIHWANSTV
jgi:hypothetical protein